MIGYATLGTNNLERARAFYDALLTEIGAKRLMELPQANPLWPRSWPQRPLQS